LQALGRSSTTRPHAHAHPRLACKLNSAQSNNKHQHRHIPPPTHTRSLAPVPRAPLVGIPCSAQQDQLVAVSSAPLNHSGGCNYPPLRAESLRDVTVPPEKCTSALHTHSRLPQSPRGVDRPRPLGRCAIVQQQSCRE
ncbi:hypothetical protein COCVIDRAFT_97939, partial [Bipolaris victoriae FI3]